MSVFVFEGNGDSNGVLGSTCLCVFSSAFRSIRGVD